MKIAFVGKGGSGKTTLSALFSRYLASQQFPVLAIDADINQHLAVALGSSQEDTGSIPPLGSGIDRIKDYLRGNNPRILSTASMIKTTPPGKGSRLLRLTENNSIYSHFRRKIGNVDFMATGPFGEEDLGVKCYHSKVGAVELLLNHMIDKEREYIVVDMTAGSDSFASGMFTKFDMTFLVSEPTLKGLTVYRQYKDYAKNHDVKIGVIGNKVENNGDLEFLRNNAGDDLITVFTKSDYVKTLEKGNFKPLEQLEELNLDSLKVMKQIVDGAKKEWQKFYAQTVEFHIKNAESWANSAAGEDLTKQVDPNFSLPIK
jgi:CO dehydrogenase maturation factor